MVIPDVLTNDIVNCVHYNLGHVLVFKTTMYIRQFYYWRSMNQHNKKFVLTCDLYQRVKFPNVNMRRSRRRVESTSPYGLVGVDFYGPLLRSTGTSNIFSLFQTCFPNT